MGGFGECASPNTDAALLQSRPGSRQRQKIQVIKHKDVHTSHKVTLQASYLLNTGMDELASP